MKSSGLGDRREQAPADTPDLSVVIVTYNSPELLATTLASVEQHTHGISYETLVVDSASPDQRVSDAVSRFPGVRLVRLSRNRGFAAANNVGLRLSRGRYAVLLNPDTRLRDDALSTLVQWMDAHPDVGAAGPQLVGPDGRPQPYSHGDAPSPAYLLRRLLSHAQNGYLHVWDGVVPRSTDWVAGTCMLVRSVAIERVGLLDERFFLYFEDVDWGLRFNRAGWRVAFVPDVRVTHVGGGSVGPAATRHYDRSLAYFYGKHYGRGMAVAAVAGLVLYRRLQTAFRLLSRLRCRR